MKPRCVRWVGRIYRANLAELSHCGTGDDRTATLVDYIDTESREITYGLDLQAGAK